MADRHRPGYNAEFEKTNYDRVLILVPKGKKQVLKDLANSKGMSMTQATIEALESYYGINLTD